MNRRNILIGAGAALAASALPAIATAAQPSFMTRTVYHFSNGMMVRSALRDVREPRDPEIDDFVASVIGNFAARGVELTNVALLVGGGPEPWEQT